MHINAPESGDSRNKQTRGMYRAFRENFKAVDRKTFAVGAWPNYGRLNKYGQVKNKTKASRMRQREKRKVQRSQGLRESRRARKRRVRAARAAAAGHAGGAASSSAGPKPEALALDWDHEAPSSPTPYKTTPKLMVLQQKSMPLHQKAMPKRKRQNCYHT